MMGGEHTVTLGALRASEQVAIVDFDAHFDLRNEFLGTMLSHATFLRRSLDERKRPTIVLGARAVSKEELAYAREIDYMTARQISKNKSEENLEAVLNLLPKEMPVYITVDMDALDPSEAPAVCNPAPEGISFSKALDILQGICVRRTILGIDLCEVTPYYDSGLTSIQAAKLLLELILASHKGRTRIDVSEQRG